MADNIKTFKGLPEEVAKKFDLLQEPGIYITKYPDRETVDLKSISAEKAEELYNKGLLPMLKRKGKKKSSKGSTPPGVDTPGEETPGEETPDSTK